MNQELKFDFGKAVQALNYVAVKSGKKINKMKAIKLLYFADRYHLRKYGRPILNDTYYAMKFGPVLSTMKDIAELSMSLSEEEIEQVKKTVVPSLDRFEVNSVSDIDEDVFSDSEIEALDFSLENFSNQNQFELAELSHEYPEWKKFEKELNSGIRSKEMNYDDFFGNSNLVNDKFNITNKYIESSKNAFEEAKSISARW